VTGGENKGDSQEELLGRLGTCHGGWEAGEGEECVGVGSELVGWSCWFRGGGGSH
jgi:hypothetical protein